jgi:recombinational DNA repair protein (RecF pathway)
VKLLFELGYAIEVNSCVACRNSLSQDSLWFSSQHGGVLCARCASENADPLIPIRANAVKMIRLFLQNSMGALAKIQATREDCDSVRLAVDDFLRWTL